MEDRQNQGLGHQLLSHWQYGVMAALFSVGLSLLGLPLIGFVALTLVVGLITLRKGASVGAYPMITSALVGGVMGLQGMPGLFYNHVLLGSLLVWLFAIILRSTKSWVTVLQVSAVMGAIAILALHWFFGDLPALWRPFIQAFVQRLNAQFLHVDTAQINLLVDMVAQFFTGFLALWRVQVNALMLLLIARGWQAKLFNPGGLRRECLNVRMDNVYTGLFLVDGLAASLGSVVAQEIFLVMLFPFAMAGLSMVYGELEKKSWRTPGKVILFLALFFQTPMMLLVFSVVGFFDVGVRFSRSFLTKNL